MLSAHFDSLVTSFVSLTATSSLLLVFVLLGSRWVGNYLYAFAAQSWMVAALAAILGYFGNVPELYFAAALTGVFRGFFLPYLVWRIIASLQADRELLELVRPATGLVLGALAVLFALAVAYRISSVLGLEGSLIVLALVVMLATLLIGFLMLAIRTEAVSQIIALLVIENGVRVGALVLAPEFPLLIELMILFDVLIAVACFGVLIRYLQTHTGTTSAAGLRRLVG